MSNFCNSNKYCEMARLSCSTVIVLMLLIFTFYCIGEKYYMIQTLHPALACVILILSLILLAYCEALHYSLIVSEKWDLLRVGKFYTRAYKIHKIMNTHNKIKKFLIGRQFIVYILLYIIVQLTTFVYNNYDSSNNNSNNISLFLYYVCRSGMPGLVLTFTFGQILSQLFCETYTIQTLNIQGSYSVVQLCLFIEKLGVGYVCNLSFFIISRLFFMKVIRAGEEMDEGMYTCLSFEYHCYLLIDNTNLFYFFYFHLFIYVVNSGNTTSTR